MAHIEIELKRPEYDLIKDFTKKFYIFDKTEDIRVNDRLTFLFLAEPKLYRYVTYVEEIGEHKIVSIEPALQTKSAVPFTVKSGSFNFQTM